MTSQGMILTSIYHNPQGYGAVVGHSRRFLGTPGSIPIYGVFIDFHPNGGRSLGMSGLLRQPMLAPPNLSSSSVGAAEGVR